jgi:hypothetical protein
MLERKRYERTINKNGEKTEGRSHIFDIFNTVYFKNWWIIFVPEYPNTTALLGPWFYTPVQSCACRHSARVIRLIRILIARVERPIAEKVPPLGPTVASDSSPYWQMMTICHSRIPNFRNCYCLLLAQSNKH